MSTLRQIAANRRNAQKSTGPRSPEGKAASRFNAHKHGIDAKSQCLPSENKESLETLAAEYHQRFAPTTPEERALVDILISSEWDLRRHRVASAQLWQWAAASHTYTDPKEVDLPMADGFQYRDKTFMRLQRAIDSSQRNYLHALKALQQLQSVRGQSSQTEDTKPSTGQLASFRKHPASSPSALPEPPLPAAVAPLPPSSPHSSGSRDPDSIKC